MMQLPPINMLSSTAPLGSSARASNLQTQINLKSKLMNFAGTIMQADIIGQYQEIPDMKKRNTLAVMLCNFYCSIVSILVTSSKI